MQEQPRAGHEQAGRGVEEADRHHREQGDDGGGEPRADRRRGGSSAGESGHGRAWPAEAGVMRGSTGRK